MKALFYLTTAAFFWGLNFHLAKVMLQNAPFLEAGFWRYFSGVIFLLVLSMGKLPSFQTFMAHRVGFLKVGVIGLFGFNIFFFLGLQHTTAVNAALIFSLNPAMTLILSHYILKTPLKGIHILGILIAFFGVLFLLSKGEWQRLLEIQFTLGDILIVIANLAFASHHVWVKKYAGNVSNQEFTLITNILCLSGFIVTLPFIETGNFATYPFPFWLATLGIGGLGTALAYLVWNIGVQQVGANHAGIFINVIPLSTAFLALFFGEPLYYFHFVSGTVIFIGLLVMRFEQWKSLKLT